MSNAAEENKSTKPPHAHQDNDHDMPTDCPTGYHYCRMSIGGWVMCKDCPPPLEYNFTSLAIPCGVEDPTVQVMSHINLLANAHLELVNIVDLGHNGWIAYFRKATIYP